MKTHLINFAGMAVMDGGALERLLEKELARVAADCENRPGVKTARTITIKLSTTPQLDTVGDLTTVSSNTEIELKDAKLPPFRSRPVNAQHKNGGRMVWNELSQGNAAQRTLDPSAFPEID